MEWRKIDDDTYEGSDVITIASLRQLRVRLSALQEKLKETPPDDDELRRLGMASHPYYTDRERWLKEVDTISAQIEAIEALSAKPAPVER